MQHIFKPGKVMTMPESLSVEPAAMCNLSCPECTLGRGLLKRQGEMLRMETFNKVLHELSPWLINCQFYLQGEPTLNRQLCQMIAEAHKNKIFTNTSTNGQLLTPLLCKELVSSGLDQIIVSVDGTTQDVYEKYRIGGSLQKAADGIKALSAARRELRKSNPAIILQFIVFRHNEHQISEIKQFARKHGADKVTLKSAQIENPDTAEQMLPTNKKFSRYRKSSNGKYYIVKKLPINCFRLRQTFVMAANGDVLACCYDKNGMFTMGNVTKEPSSEIWKCEKFNDFRLNIWRTKTPPGICENCIG